MAVSYTHLDVYKRQILETTINLVVSLVSVANFGMIGVLFGTVAALLYRSNEIIYLSLIHI